MSELETAPPPNVAILRSSFQNLFLGFTLKDIRPMGCCGETRGPEVIFLKSLWVAPASDFGEWTLGGATTPTMLTPAR